MEMKRKVTNKSGIRENVPTRGRLDSSVSHGNVHTSIFVGVGAVSRIWTKVDFVVVVQHWASLVHFPGNCRTGAWHMCLEHPCGSWMLPRWGVPGMSIQHKTDTSEGLFVAAGLAMPQCPLWATGEGGQASPWDPLLDWCSLDPDMDKKRNVDQLTDGWRTLID